ncbi:YheC/YheD family protein [Paenibacillus septentrionalis]|uniref:YheC/YheD family protein n=1 Tax=Paenibacillus septentrionalis TaxID=429342 RepID=A0ABW1UZT7_9BACL
MKKLKLGVVVAKIDIQQQAQGTSYLMPEPIYFKELALASRKHNIDLFIISAMEWAEQGLFGYRWHSDAWHREPVPLPDIIYDRCFFSHAKQRQAYENMLAAFKHRKGYQSFNNTLPNKLIVYDSLSTVEELIPYLPHTEPLNSMASVTKWLSLYPEGVVIKPAAGMHGKGVLHVSYQAEFKQFHIRGRNLRNESIEISFSNELNALKWLYRFKKELSYMIQPYLALRTKDQKPFDIRVLMQKDHTGQWRLTGSMARVGHPHGLTSNMHGGGEAYEPYPLLAEKMGSYKAERLLKKIHMISGQTVSAIEGHFGRFGELALDFGVTAQGSIWLLECNSKPGRLAFSEDKADSYRHAHERPLAYALYLQQRVASSQKVI